VLWRKKVWAEHQLAPILAEVGVTFEEARGMLEPNPPTEIAPTPEFVK
jgi:hypothetical protein